MILSAIISGCGGGKATKPAAEWTKSKKIAGSEQKLSHVSGLVVDDKFIYATIGGTIADQNEGTSGVRKIALDTGAVTILDDGKDFPQAETGGIAADEKFIYWNVGGKILRVSKDGGTAAAEKPETIVSENVGIGVDMAVDDEKIYWMNHGYYSPNSPPPSPRAIYAVSKQGGRAEIFAAEQKNPGSPVADEKFVYWITTNGVLKQAKSGGGQPQVVFQAASEEGVDVLEQDAENLYFGFRGAGASGWALRKMSKQGGGGESPQTLAETFSLSPFAVDEANIYFFAQDGASKHALYKVPKNGGAAAKLDAGYSGGVVAQSKTAIYFASLDDIYAFAK